MTNSNNLKYTKEHEWILSNDAEYCIGITAYAAKQLGEIVYVDLPTVGDKVKTGAVIAEIESTKSVGELYAPVNGVIIAVNDELSNSPENINEDPYGKGWILKIKADEEIGETLSLEEYEQLIS